MAIPSFDELLSRARQIAESNADRESSTRTNSLISKGVSGFVDSLLNTPMGEKETYVGAVTPEGQYSSFDQPIRTGGTMADRIAGKMFGGQSNQSIPKGSFPVTQKQLGEKALGNIFKQRDPAEQVDVLDPKTGKPLGHKVTKGSVFLPVEKSAKEIGLETMIRETADNLPKLQAAASSQQTNIQSINKALEMIKKGNVTGKGGQIKAFIAPYAEFAGVDTEGMSEAQTFQLLTRVIVGPMRLDIIGPGPVSEWEQKLMQQISGGGGSAKAAAQELLKTYKRLAKNKVDLYNTSVKGAYTLSPRFQDLYSPIEIEDLEEASAPSSTVDHSAALKWANDHPNDPRSAAIKQRALQAK